MLKKNKFLFISVTLHLIVMYVVAQSVMFPAALDMPLKKQEIIQASLVFDLPPLIPEIPVEEMKEDIPPPIELEEKSAVAETPPDNPIEPISEPGVPASPPQAQPLPPKRETEVPEAAPNNEENEMTPNEQRVTPIPSSEVHAPATSMARRHLNSFQQQQRNKMAEQASRYYQQHKNSPVINAEVKNPFMTEDEKLRDSIKLRADCSSASKQTAAVLLGFLGGQIDCSTPPPISGFIQNRINKKSDLSGKNQQKEQKTPQSVVIKKQS
ncbi:hypothetical protein [Paraglaciecola sp. MB-3u-78]|uniref:hypothetical protein n=1 Tax=Paraglaciecola sp. MB-3u-78 TaxID=2058332 RepID=UPI001E65862E|nr:hypothetical protein [Paraglaciecola sp. MB-3u-78]